MLDTRVKKTLCTICAHKEVCTHKQDFLDIIRCIDSISRCHGDTGTS